jgi:FKBP-type peptidyl-prolyl cis-trans isomerase
MRKRKLMVGVCFGLMMAGAHAEDAQSPKSEGSTPSVSTLTTEKDRTSYVIGVAAGRGLRQQGAQEFNIDVVIRGLKDAFTNQPLLMSEENFKATYQAYQQEAIRRVGKAREFAAIDNKKAGDSFLAENARKDGVISLPSGVQYKVIVAGTGGKPTDDDTITANYRGTLIDGTEFDSTYKRNQPATFEVKRTIAGWREALSMMPVGSKWQVFIPAELAYSKQGAGTLIGPMATLIFELELLSINNSASEKKN